VAFCSSTGCLVWRYDDGRLRACILMLELVDIALRRGRDCLSGHLEGRVSKDWTQRLPVCYPETLHSPPDQGTCGADRKFTSQSNGRGSLSSSQLPGCTWVRRAAHSRVPVRIRPAVICHPSSPSSKAIIDTAYAMLLALLLATQK
jgi:hypothetical protein